MPTDSQSNYYSDNYGRIDEGDNRVFNYLYGTGDDVETELTAIGFGEAPPAQPPPDSKLPPAA